MFKKAKSSRQATVGVNALAANLLAPLLLSGPQLPFRSGALRPQALVVLVNDVLLHDRKRIFEFGSGLSTLMLGRLAKLNRLNLRIVALEHSEVWVSRLSRLLETEGTRDFIDIVHTPLAPCSTGWSGSEPWYDVARIPPRLLEEKFDMALIDGPVGGSRGIEHGRFPAMPFIRPYLAPSHSIYLDDADRRAER